MSESIPVATPVASGASVTYGPDLDPFTAGAIAGLRLLLSAPRPSVFPTGEAPRDAE